jgi:site-specific DNA-methyltransferase (adenine-specific)
MKSNTIELVKTNSLKPSHFHNTLYGSSEELDDLFIKSIEQHGIKTPLLVSSQNVIISGVLRHRVAIKLGLEMVPVIFSDKPLEEYQIAMLNLGRKKLPSIILREYQLLKPLFQVGKGCRTDIIKANSKLDVKETLGVSKNTVQRLSNIDKYSKVLWGTTESKEYKDMWQKLDTDKVKIATAEKQLKLKVDIKKGKTIACNVDFIRPDYKIYCANSKDLNRINDESIQTIITSVPYYDKRDYEIGSDQLGHEKSPFEFVKNLTIHFEDCKRVLKKNGSLFVNMGDYVINRRYKLIPLHFALEMEKRGWILNDHIIWAKNNPTPTFGKRTICCTEHIFHFVLSTHFDFDLNWLNEEASNRPEISSSGIFWGLGTPNSKPRSFMDFRGHNIINSNSSCTTWLKNKCEEKGIPFSHSATFPEIIPEIFIRTTSKIGDTVMDIFSGTSTGGCVANVLGRNYVGFELNASYIQQGIVRYENPFKTSDNLLKSA